jgi:hypothetical protein
VELCGTKHRSNVVTTFGSSTRRLGLGIYYIDCDLGMRDLAIAALKKSLVDELFPTTADVRDMANDCARGLYFMHPKAQITRSDVKLQNIVVFKASNVGM